MQCGKKKTKRTALCFETETETSFLEVEDSAHVMKPTFLFKRREIEKREFLFPHWGTRSRIKEQIEDILTKDSLQFARYQDSNVFPKIYMHSSNGVLLITGYSNSSIRLMLSCTCVAGDETTGNLCPSFHSLCSSFLLEQLLWPKQIRM